ncbi:hypothetical protein [Prochlorococcus sp. MIT 1303]|uniref:hypothetical protein n=1 Tax=Prochlorococcus sp. MIT 1303 TaxID=1723647 RepID=UPI0007BB2566|nr:hypothetical protein [Prochlorococcus sp. MIT 1303]KZR64385.1 GLTT repeat (6 copies) [Prochlorococcus sp. MIT 1303]
MKPKIVDGPNQSKRGEEFSALAKIFAIGIAPRGIIAIGIVPMGFVSIGVVSMGLVSIGCVGMGAISACLVGMGIWATGMNVMAAWEAIQIRVHGMLVIRNPIQLYYKPSSHH